MMLKKYNLKINNLSYLPKIIDQKHKFECYFEVLYEVFHIGLDSIVKYVLCFVERPIVCLSLQLIYDLLLAR